MTPPAEKVAEPFSEIIQFMDKLVESHAKSSDMNHEIAHYAACARDVCKRELTRLNAAAPAPSVAQSEREAKRAGYITSANFCEAHAREVDTGGEGGRMIAAHLRKCAAAIHLMAVADPDSAHRASAGSARTGRFAVEEVAEIVHDAMRFKREGETQPWVHAGNSFAQDRARDAARAIIAAHTHSAPPALTEEERAEIAKIVEYCLDDYCAAGPQTYRDDAATLLAIITRLTS